MRSGLSGPPHVLKVNQHEFAHLDREAQALDTNGGITLPPERAEKLGVAARYVSGEEMIRKEALDIVSVATPNKFHKPLTIAALRAALQ